MSRSSSIHYEPGPSVGSSKMFVTMFNGSSHNPAESEEISDYEIHGFPTEDKDFPEYPMENGVEDEEDEINTDVDVYGFMKGENTFLQRELPIQVLRKRERKWLEMLDNWPTYMNKHFLKVKSRCRKGIPPSLRSRAWQYLCGAHFHMHHNPSRVRFEQLDALEAVGMSDWTDDIAKDIHRQFPNHELFSRQGLYGKIGQEDLFRLLKAWTILHPEEGYCQAQAPIAATLLMHMPVSEAFQCFLQICDKYLPDYYSAGLEAVKLDGCVLQGMLKRVAPGASKLLKKLGVDPTLYMIEWFMCAFCRTLPWPSVLRVWDMFFCEGVKILFRVGLVLLRYGLDRREYTDLYEVLESLKNLPPHILEEKFLVEQMFQLRLTDEDFEREHYRQWKSYRKRKEKEMKNQATDFRK